ncbi:response regulator, partial [Thermococcus sp. M36]|uniref:response regulator n=1 Tax=Thermococcus sp. M36 TaxID=1638261 RepID=UPI001439B538
MADSKTRFLVVDDYSTIRRIIRNLLKELGHTDVDEAEDGSMALSKLKKERFDFVISDWNMPILDGLGLVKEMRNDRSLASIPILFVTAEAKTEIINAVSQYGV